MPINEHNEGVFFLMMIEMNKNSSNYCFMDGVIQIFMSIVDK
jgi:hypothetical protein